MPTNVDISRETSVLSHVTAASLPAEKLMSEKKDPAPLDQVCLFDTTEFEKKVLLAMVVVVESVKQISGTLE